MHLFPRSAVRPPQVNQHPESATAFRCLQRDSVEERAEKKRRSIVPMAARPRFCLRTLVSLVTRDSHWRRMQRADQMRLISLPASDMCVIAQGSFGNDAPKSSGHRRLLVPATVSTLPVSPARPPRKHLPSKMDNLPTAPGTEHIVTRELLVSGSLIGSLRANPPIGVTFRTDTELDESLDDVLRDHDPNSDLHVFAYGSLMWNPAMEATQAGPGRAHGWHRRFCLRILLGRGSHQEPGAMLGLDRGGTCRGVLLRIEAAKVRSELRLLWQREMIAQTYNARWIRVETGAGSARALTFVVDRTHERYIGSSSIADIARLIRTGKGVLGSSRAYFDSTMETLERLGIRDSGMERLRAAVLLSDTQAES